MRASFISYFLEIAEEEYSRHDGLMGNFLDERGKYDHELIGPFLEEAIMLEKLYMKVIVFLASYLESYIWDIAATYLGEKYAEKLDKLSTPDKWDVIPRLALGHEFIIKQHHKGLLKELIAERNRLMHHKSIEVSPFMGMGASAKPVPKELLNFWDRVDLKAYFTMSKTLTSELDKEIKDMR